MICVKCDKDLRFCICPDVTKRLRDCVAMDHVYVGNIIEQRYANGLSKPDDFAGLNIHHPLTIASAMAGILPSAPPLTIESFTPQESARTKELETVDLGGES